MPCGGIYPVSFGWDAAFFATLADAPLAECWVCQAKSPTPDHFCDEWDCFLHRDCIIKFLNTEEGRIVMDHGHEVVIAAREIE